MFPKGMGNLGNLGGMLKQAMEMKGRIEELKERLGQETIEASSGGGMVRVVLNGRLETLSVKIDPEVIDRNEPEMLETLVQAAFNEAAHKAQEMIRQKMSELTGGIELPGLT